MQAAATGRNPRLEQSGSPGSAEEGGADMMGPPSRGSERHLAGEKEGGWARRQM